MSENSPTFFGLTSHPHVSSPVDQSQTSGADEFATLGIDLDSKSPHFRAHLIQSFFKYQSLWVEIVDKECFMANRSNAANSRWYCDFLEYSILACATRLSTSSAVRALGREYAQLAKTEILGALHEPSPANLQAFLLISEYEVTLGNDRPGWMFCGR